MYLLDADGRPRSRRCASALAALGDSLVVVGGEGLWNVHVHVDDVGAAIEAGIEAGRPHRIRVTHFAEQIAAARAAAPRAERAGAGSSPSPPARGSRALFEAGRRRRGRRRPGPTPLDRRDPRRHRRARRGRGRRAAQRPRLGPVAPRSRRAPAEDDEGMRVAVIPTRAQVQGLAALAVHEPGRTLRPATSSR